MPPINDLLELVKKDFTAYRFEPSDCFKWIPTHATIGYCVTQDSSTGCLDLLHEVAHAQLGHTDYLFDIQLLRQEAAAWQLARVDLAPRYKIAIDDNYIEECLDSYRDWLHTRSVCPNCDQTGLQTQTSAYSCSNCGRSWVVNEARQCALRRFLLT